MIDELFPLLKELESDNFEIRKSAMERLAKLRTDEVVEALIHVAKGEHKTAKPIGRLRKIWLELINHPRFRLEDQLAAIQSLAETGHHKAHNYLIGLTEYEVRGFEDHTNYGQGDNSTHQEYFKYLNLAGNDALARKIRVDIPDGRSTYNDEQYRLLRILPEGTKGNSPIPFHKCQELDIIVNAQKRIKETAAQYR